METKFFLQMTTHILLNGTLKNCVMTATPQKVEGKFLNSTSFCLFLLAGYYVFSGVL
jgi:hypothetical protein